MTSFLRTRTVGLTTIVLGALLAGCAASAAPQAGDATARARASEVAPDAAGDAYHVRLTHDHPEGDATATFEIASGSGPYDVTLAHYPLGEPPAGECANVDARIEVFGPSGAKVYGFGGVTWAGPTIGACSLQPHSQVGLAPGIWTVRFSGFGVLTGVVEIAET